MALMGLAVSCYCLTNYHKLSGLKQQPYLLANSSVDQKSSKGWLGFLHRVSEAKIKVSAKPSSHLESLFHGPSCWQNSIPFSCTTKVPFPCWLSARGHLAPRDCLHFLPHGPFCLQDSSDTLNPSLASNL